MATKVKNPKVPPHTCNTAGPIQYPKTDKEFRERLNEKGGTPGEDHERDAARHNQYEITRAEGSASRAAGDKRSALSGTSEEDQVKFTCAICGKVQPGEVDHVGEQRDGDKDLVEAKSGESFNPAQSQDETDRNQRQMERLGQAAQGNGMGITYKVPEGHTQAAAEIAETAETMGLDVSVVFV